MEGPSQVRWEAGWGAECRGEARDQRPCWGRVEATQGQLEGGGPGSQPSCRPSGWGAGPGGPAWGPSSLVLHLPPCGSQPSQTLGCGGQQSWEGQEQVPPALLLPRGQATCVGPAGSSRGSVPSRGLQAPWGCGAVPRLPLIPGDGLVGVRTRGQLQASSRPHTGRARVLEPGISGPWEQLGRVPQRGFEGAPVSRDAPRKGLLRSEWVEKPPLLSEGRSTGSDRSPAEAASSRGPQFFDPTDVRGRRFCPCVSVLSR